MKFNILGPLEVVDDGRDCTPSAPKMAQVLALLLVRANRIVSVDALIEELWSQDPPRSASTTAQTYIYHLRKAFAQDEDGSGAKDVLCTRGPGYLLRVDEDGLDAAVFERLIRSGQAHLDAGRTREAADELRRALDLWRGEALCTVAYGEVVAAHVTHLEELRLRALELRIEADQMLGRHRELVPELRALVVEHPLHEWFHGHLMTSLFRCGRRAEALQVFQNLRTVLDRELGLDPSDELRALQNEVLGAPAAATGRQPVLRRAA